MSKFTIYLGGMTMDAREIQDVFFEAMKRGYAASAPKITVPGLPGSKSILIRIGEYSILDYWFTAPDSDYSYGSTLISVAERPLWIMHFGGWYRKSVIPFLKRALARNYNENIFLGGRGPQRLEGEDHTLQYLNKVEQNDFSDFRGYEHIIAASEQVGTPGEKLGEHHYFGGLFQNNQLIQAPKIGQDPLEKYGLGYPWSR